MQDTVVVKADGSDVLIADNETELAKSDNVRRILHVLPTVFIPQCFVGKISPTQVILEVTASAGLEIEPSGGTVIRQLYPNPRYLVGGSEQASNGWIVDIPADMHEISILFSWEFCDAWKWWKPRIDDLLIRHQINVTLLPGEGQTYTMDANCWPRGKVQHTDQNGGTPVGLMGHPTDEDPRETMLRDIVAIEPLVSNDDDEVWGGQYIEENLSIPPVHYEKAWSINAFAAPDCGR